MATRLSASVAPRVNTISFAEAAPIRAATCSRVPSNARVASRLSVWPSSGRAYSCV